MGMLILESARSDATSIKNSDISSAYLSFATRSYTAHSSLIVVGRDQNNP